MSLFSSLNLLAFIIYFYLVVYILVKNPKPLLRRLCAVFVGCLAWWSLTRIFIYTPYAAKDTVIFFANIGSLGWISLGSFHLWFTLVFSEKKEILEKKYLYWLLLGFPLILIPVQCSGLLMGDFIRGDFGWRPILGQSIWPYLFFLYTVTFLAVSLLLVFQVMRKPGNKIKQQQARIIFFCMLISICGSVGSDTILPLMHIYDFPNLANFFGLIWASGIVFAMARYKFMAIMPVTSLENLKAPSLDCLIFLNPQGNIASINDAVSDLLGYRNEELKGQSFNTILVNDKAETTLIDRILNLEDVGNQEIALRSHKGKKIPVTFSASLLQDEEGTVEGIVCVARDITELKRNEILHDVLFHISEAVRRSVTLRELLEIIQQQVAKLMDAKNFYVALVVDKENALYTFPFIADVNPEELELPDVPITLPRSFTDYVCRTRTPLLADKKKYNELLAQEDIRLLGTKPMSWLGVPLKTAEDEVIGVVVVQSYTDGSAYSESDLHVLSIISNTIAGAIKYKQAEEALRASEEQYRTLIENIQDGVFLIYQRRIEFVNDAFARMIGFTVEELIGKDFSRQIAAQDLELVESRYSRRLLGEKVPDEYEFRMVHKNGTAVYVNMNVGLIKYKDGFASIGTLKDITGKIKAEKEKKELEEKLARSEKMEALGRLAGGVAHDLNNVLSAIVSYPDLLLLKLPQDSPLRKPISVIQQSGQKAAAIVQDLLTLARRGVSIKKIHNLNDIISDYLNSPVFEKLSKYHTTVHFNTRLEKNLPRIKGSSIHLSKTLMNLAANAAEAIPAGRPGEIIITTEKRILDSPVKSYYHIIAPGNYTVLTVTDNGVGISPADLGKIFDPFYTKKEMGRSGTGLGMAVVWGTIEDHKGFIDIQSIEGQGTTFTLYFPVSHEKEMQEEENHVPLSNYRGKGEKILVIDDELEQRELAIVLLTELGYRVQSVASGEEAIEYMKNDSVDLLLLDMLMTPGMDGLETYQEILKLRPGTKAIITSGFSESDRVKKALKLGAGLYIKKPYTMEKIGITVSKELHKDKTNTVTNEIY